MNNTKIYEMPFSKLYPLYLEKAQKKQRTKTEVNQIIFWLTGYNDDSFQEALSQNINLKSFFANAPSSNPKSSLITGTICGVKIEDIEDPLMKQIRYLDKLIDELAKGKPLDKILR